MSQLAPLRENVQHAPAPDFEDWMLAQGLSPRTIEQRVEFADWRWREWGTWDLQSTTIATWLSDYSGWTRLTYHAHLASVYRWLEDTGQVERSPMAGIRRPPKPSSSPRPLTPDEVSSVLGHARGQVKAWMLLALLAGLRAHEVAKFRGHDITPQYVAVLGKGGKAAAIPTHPVLWDLASTYPRRGLWFPSPVNPGQPHGTGYVSQLVAEQFRDVGIERGSIHRLRATFGTNLVRGGVNLRVVQTLMRHSSLATTELYLGVDEDERASAIGQLMV